MGRTLAWAAVAAVIVAAVAIALPGKPRPPLDNAAFSEADEKGVAQLLSDRARPWWQGHKLPMPPLHQIHYQSPNKMGSFAEPPAGCPVMPIELARSLLAGRAKLPSDHPFAGRPVLLVDMRIRSLHLVEHIPVDVNVPYDRMAESLKTGDLKGTDPRTVVILYGDLFPHFDATAPFRVEKFEAYYCLEGGLAAWKAKGYPVVSNAPVSEYLKALESEKVVGTGAAPPDPADIGPAALKALLDQGLEATIVFVGDERTFAAGRIPGAIRVPQNQVTAHFEKEPRDRLVVVYCGCCEGSAKGLSGIAVEELRKLKFTRLLHLSGHLKAWKDQGYSLDVN
jgi:rhodanese-related sulfurtransferase